MNRAIESSEHPSVGIIKTALMRPHTYAGYAREVLSTAHLAARYPMGLVETSTRRSQPSGNPLHDTPVLLVHGFAHNRSGWFALDRDLRSAGFTSVHAMNYFPFLAGIPELAESLAKRIEEIRSRTGADKVHVLGHSMGGILLRWYVQELGGDAVVDTAVTVASPHEGTRAAHVGIGPTAHDLRPGSSVMRRLAAPAGPSAVRWIAYYSNLDAFVQPARSAMIRHPDLAATNHFVKDAGHLGILLSRRVSRSIVEQLEAAEGVSGIGKILAMPSSLDEARQRHPSMWRRDAVSGGGR